MNWQDIALALAGAIGSIVAIIHGVLLERHLIARLKPVLAQHKSLSLPMRRLVPPLLHLSTFAWFFGGLALIAAALWAQYDGKLALGAFVGSLYLFGAIGNLWATRRFHPGWILMTLAIVLICASLYR